MAEGNGSYEAILEERILRCEKALRILRSEAGHWEHICKEQQHSAGWILGPIITKELGRNRELYTLPEDE